MRKSTLALATAILFFFLAAGCTDSDDDALHENPDVEYTPWDDGMPQAGNPDGNCPVPDDAMEEDATAPDHVIGNGTKESCTSQAVVEAIAQGGVITFDCGPDPVTILLEETAKIFNDTGPEIVIDGGGKVALSGGGARRILYMNTCDENQVWTTIPLPGPGPPAAHGAEPHLCRRQLQLGRRVRRRRRHLGPRRPVQGGQLPVLQQLLRRRRTRTSAARVSASSASTRVSPSTLSTPPSAAPKIWQRRLERRRDQQHRRLVDDHQQPVFAQPGYRQRRQPRPKTAPPAAAAAARSTTTATR